MISRSRVLVLGLALVLGGCGASGAPVRSATPEVKRSPSTDAPTLPPEEPSLLVEYVVVHRRWVETLVPTSPETVKAWSEAPENAATLGSMFRQILVRVRPGTPDAAAKKKADGILVRLAKGEDFSRLAAQLSEEVDMSDRFTELPKEVSATFAALAPGQTATVPVRSAEGYHVVRKERPSEEALELAYRRAKAPEVAAKLGAELTARLRGGAPARSAIAEGTEAVLGERGASDPNRPKPQSVPRANVEHVRLPAAARAALVTFARGAHAGDVLPSPAVDGDTLVVARVRTP